LIRALALAVVVLFAPPAMADGGPFVGTCAPTPVFVERFAAPDISPRWTMILHPAIANSNRELQAYEADAVATGPQGLRLTARRRAGGYASGRIASKAVFRYGCFDIVARMPAGRGLWPALWLRTPYGQALNGEIDMMEGFGSHPGVFQSTLHRWAAGVHHGFTCTRIGDLRASLFGLTRACGWQPRWWPDDFTEAPHHYGLIWTPRAVTWLIDGTPYYMLRDGVPDGAMAIQLNLAVGGIFDGNPDGGTMFPAAMTVRSVTVWPLLANGG
jgi:beta-glucanase (GH16 family)